jgi:muconolactone delta-isomerase
MRTEKEVCTLLVLNDQDEESTKGKGTTCMECMVSATFRPQDQAEILARIPQEQARIQTLKEQGTVEALYIGSDLAHIWIVMQGESQDQVQQVLESLPLYPYMEIAITPLSRM